MNKTWKAMKKVYLKMEMKSYALIELSTNTLLNRIGLSTSE